MLDDFKHNSELTRFRCGVHAQMVESQVAIVVWNRTDLRIVVDNHFQHCKMAISAAGMGSIHACIFKFLLQDLRSIVIRFSF